MAINSSFGKVRPSDKARDDAGWRTAFATDHDRVLYSPEFRRLAGVTQVISPQHNYVMHDRLTHSLKVSQTAERTAQYLIGKHGGRGRTAYLKAARELKRVLSPDVCAVAGLAHDLGHPPFGHAAEEELQRVLATGLDVLAVRRRPVLADSFEGNAQSFRIVAKLSLRKQEQSPTEQGLNLTWRILGALAKYPWLHGAHPATSPKLANKWSFYNSESAYMAELSDRGIINSYGAADLRQSLESQVMDWADDIAYAVHDLEDFFRTRRTPINELRVRAPYLSAGTVVEHDAVWAEIVNLTFNRLAGRVVNLADGSETTFTKDDLFHLAETIRLLFPEEPFDGSLTSHAVLQAFSSSMIRELQSACSLVELTAGHFYLKIDSSGRLLAELLKSLTHFYVINTPGVRVLQQGQKRAISEVFEYMHELVVETFVDSKGAASERRLPAKLAEYARFALESNDLDDYRNDEARLARAVIDYLCTLTDAQASLLHQRMSGDAIADQGTYWLNT